MKCALILLPLPFEDGFDYAIPQGLAVQPGDYVRIPFGPRELYGVVWALKENPENSHKLKMIAARAAHIPPMAESLRRLIDWVAYYTLAPKGTVLKLAMPVRNALHRPASQTHYHLSDDADILATSKARRQIVSLLADGFARTQAEIVEQTGISASTVRGFLAKGGLVGHEVEVRPALPDYDLTLPPPKLSLEQKQAADALRESLNRGFSVHVLDGVTGSGKTEVYFDNIAHLLEDPEVQILVLLPEIALSVQWLERFRKRFGDAPHLWHSGVPAARKRESWRAIARGEARLVVGARSALFLPFKNLRLIIVDEEHEPAFKQEEGVIYQGRDMAVLRARQEEIPIYLISATPALETLYNIEQGKYQRVHLPRRHGGATLPDVSLIDMRQHRPGPSEQGQQWISAPLREAVAETLGKGQQAMLFINRRGYAPMVLCRACGHRFSCPHCSAWLVMHTRTQSTHPPAQSCSHGQLTLAIDAVPKAKAPPKLPESRLQCHHCDFRTPLPNHCPECGEVAEDSLVPCGPGAERLMAEARIAFPEAAIGLMTSDALPTPQAVEALIEKVSAGEIQLLIGTQMMAKGHHFPGLSLVGVVDADLGLAGGDLRAAERSWQLLHQLAGRAGRAQHAGKVLLQTYLPEHPVMEALTRHDRDGFLALEMAAREQAGMPPFGRLAALVIEGPHEGMVRDYGKKLLRYAPQLADVQIFGPAPAPLAILRNKYRYRMLVKAARTVNMPALLRGWLTSHRPPNSIKLKIDVDPYSFM
jgi:primosomal protein N' (replication factor Y)